MSYHHRVDYILLHKYTTERQLFLFRYFKITGSKILIYIEA